MERLRVLVVTSSAIIRDILLRGLSRDPRFEVQSSPMPRRRRDLAPELLSRQPDVIVLSPATGEEPIDALELLLENPSTVVVTLGDEGRTATVQCLRPQTDLLSNVSVTELAASIVTACESGRDLMPRR
jgi:chemotaxis response regulator CheB